MQKRVHKGESLQSIKAQTFNTMIDASEFFKRHRHNIQSHTNPDQPLHQTVALCKNQTGGDLDSRGLIVGLGATLFTSSDNVDKFFSGTPCLVGETPDIARSTISENKVKRDGGGICISTGTVKVASSNISMNEADDGGGFFSKYGSVIVENSVISGNSSNHNGGGIFNDKQFTCVNSTISDNSSGYYDGGIFNVETLNVTNSTIASNSAQLSGGGIYSSNDRYFVNIHNSAIWNNDSAGEGDSIDFKAGTLDIASSLITAPGAISGINGEWNDAGGNLIGLDPAWTEVLDETGNIFFCRPNPGSLLIDAGNDTLAVNTEGDTLLTDQVGSPRFSEGNVDIGAIEHIALPGLIVTPIRGLVVSEGETGSFQVSPTVEPQAPVTVTIEQVEGGSEDLVATTATLVFDATNWNVPQQAVVTALEDQERDEDFSRFRFSGDGMTPLHAEVTSPDNDPHQTFIVNSLEDVVALDGKLTLREALQAANTNTAVYDALAGSDEAADVIIFAPSLFTTGPQAIVLAGTELMIQDNLIIQGPEAGVLAIDANQSSRVFNVARSIFLEVDKLVITGGNVQSSSDGGGICSLGPLSIVNSTIYGNTARDGGGVACGSDLITITNSTITGNTALHYGGGIDSSCGADIQINNSVIWANQAMFGGNNIGSSLTVTGSIISGNIAKNDGGGIYNITPVTMTNTIISNNAAGKDGGGIYHYSYQSSSVTGSVISNNQAAEYGGGICADDGKITLVNSTITSNTADFWGGHPSCRI